MYKNKSAAQILRACAAEDGVLSTLTLFPHGIMIPIRCKGKVCEQSIEVLDLLPRAYHCLMRANLQTVGQVVESLQNQSILKIRNLGVKSAAEIRSKLLVISYEALDEQEQLAFWETLLDRVPLNQTEKGCA